MSLTAFGWPRLSTDDKSKPADFLRLGGIVFPDREDGCGVEVPAPDILPFDGKEWPFIEGAFGCTAGPATEAIMAQ
jgi:hypothetical protein